DFDAPTGDSLLRLGVGRGGLHRGVAHADEIDPVDRNLVVEYQVADNRLGHLLRVADGSLSVTRREALYFDDVAALALQRSRHLIKSFLGVLAEEGLAGLETDFGLGRRLILVDVGDNLLNRRQTRMSLLRGLLRCGRPIPRID